VTPLWCAGMYRTGKSYILNMLMGRPAGFEVGPTVRACTKGIWLWGGVISARDMPHGDGSASVAVPAASGERGDEDVDLLFLDTEGLGSTVRSETYDSRVFALALLLSSFFVYNSVGTIDGGAISKLSLVVNLTKHIHVRAHSKDADSGSEFGQYFPQFLWLVRDFGVKLERDGRRISAREYLEDALRPEPGLGEAVEGKNAIRLLLRSFFPERDCLTMVRPVSEEAVLSRLAEQPWDALRPEFQAQLEALRRRVFHGARPKMLFGQPLTGAMLADLTIAYVDALNDNKAPTISTAWERVVDSRCAEAFDSAMQAFEDEVSALLEEVPRDTAQAGGEEDTDREVIHSVVEQVLESLDREARTKASVRSTLEAQVVDVAALMRAVDGAFERAMTLYGNQSIRDSDRATVYAERLRQRVGERRIDMLARNDADSARYCALVAKPALKCVADRMPLPGAEEGSVLSASEAADVLHRRISVFDRVYQAVARGPASARVFREMTMSILSTALHESGSRVDESVKVALSHARTEQDKLRRHASELEGQVRVAEERRVSDRSRLEGLMESAAREAAKEVEGLRALVEGKDSELKRGEARLALFRDDADTRVREADARAADAREQAAQAAKALVEAQEGALRRLEAKLDCAADLAAARAKLAALEAEVGESRAAIASAEKTAAVASERTKAAQEIANVLENEAKLLRESLEVQKELVNLRQSEKEEAEYQWGATKAELAAVESEKLEAQTQLTTWKSLAAVLKSTLVRARVARPKGLDEFESRLLESI
jgi:hypothetical protein